VSSRLGDKIRELRKAKNLTLEQLAEQTDSSKGYIWELENRDTRKPSAEKLMKIADKLGVTAEFLLDEEKSDPDDDVLKTAFFRKFEKLTEDDQKKFMKIIEGWGDK
jgi:transcriptional regulator with XRE-family HTH domain